MNRQINHLDETKKASLTSRVIVALALIALAVPCIFLGGYFYFAFIFVFLLFAIYEMIHSTRKKYSWYVYLITYITVISYFIWFVIKGNLASYAAYAENEMLADWHFSLENSFKGISVSVYMVIISFFSYCLIGIIHKEFDFNDIMYLFGMSIFIGIGFQALLFIRFYPFYAFQTFDAGFDTKAGVFKYWGSAVFFIFVVFTCIMNDTFAYFVGMFFGKHHMNERISPHKTWEGFFGGWLLGGLSGFAFVILADYFGYSMLPTVAIFNFSKDWWWIVLLSFTLPLVGDLGDFTFSLIKRHFNIKDYGTLLKAHGGVLDRVDSLSFCAIFASLLVVFIANGWNFFI